MTKPHRTRSATSPRHPRERRRAPLSRRAFVVILAAGIGVGACKTIIRPPELLRRGGRDGGP